MNQTYVVKVGDTLYGISNQFGVSVTELAELNNIKGSILPIGIVLNIPSKSGTNPNTLFIYTVKAGDTLYKLANKYNTTVDEIIKLNYLKDTSLKVGQEIRIPEMYTKEEDMIVPSYINYVVKKGDNLYSIARDNNLTVDVIMKDNGLMDEILSVGQNLKIRVSDDVIEECIGPDYIPPEDNISTTIYTVKSKDSLYSIANRFNTSVSAIISLNNLTSNNLSIGQVLKIPNSSSTTTQIYTVKSGDSLYSIARRFNTTVDSIKTKNNLKSSLLSIGQKLVI